jgi:hypothetical protein
MALLPDLSLTRKIMRVYDCLPSGENPIKCCLWPSRRNKKNTSRDLPDIISGKVFRSVRIPPFFISVIVAGKIYRSYVIVLRVLLFSNLHPAISPPSFSLKTIRKQSHEISQNSRESTKCLAILRRCGSRTCTGMIFFWYPST